MFLVFFVYAECNLTDKSLSLIVGFQSHMASFTTFIVQMMKRENLFASQGGHIILAQATALNYHLISATDQVL